MCEEELEEEEEDEEIKEEMDKIQQYMRDQGWVI